MRNTTIELGPMTINVDAMTLEELTGVVSKLLDVLTEPDATKLIEAWMKKRGIEKMEAE